MKNKINMTPKSFTSNLYCLEQAFNRLKATCIIFTMIFFTVSNMMGQTTFTNNVVINTPPAITDNYMWFERGTAPSVQIARLGHDATNNIFKIINMQSDDIAFYSPTTIQRMRIYNNGQVDIGSITSSQGNLNIMNNTAGASMLNLTDGGAINYLYVQNNGATGFVGVGTTVPLGYSGGTQASPGFPAATPFGGELLSVNGHITANGDIGVSGNLYYASDSRFKTELISLDNNWKKILKLNGYSYKFKDDKKYKFNKGKNYGFLAQEVYQILPELTTDLDGLLSVNYNAFIPFLAEGIKDHEERLNNIDEKLIGTKIEDMIAKNKSLENELEILKSANIKLEENNHNLETKFAALTYRMDNICNMPCFQDKNPAPQNNNQKGVLESKPSLFQNNPNPFTEKTLIPYYLPENTENAVINISTNEGVNMGIFPLKQNGNAVLEILPGTLSSGTYYYTLVVDGKNIDTKKMILIK